MGKMIQYSPGEILCESTGTQFLEDLPFESGKPRKARCRCGYCGNEDFIITIKKAKAGQMCNKCKKERQSKKATIYHEGDILNSLTKTTLIKRLSNKDIVAKCGRCNENYETTISSAVNGHYCSKCASEIISKKKMKYQAGDFINFPDYNLSFLFKKELEPYIDNKNKKHRKGIFDLYSFKEKELIVENLQARLDSVTQGTVSGKRYSLAMRKVTQILNNNGFNYEQEKKFPDLKSPINNDYFLYIDFFIKDKINIGIEIDGEQHNKSISFWGGDEKLLERQKNDIEKDNYFANKPNYQLLRFSDSEVKLSDFEEKFLSRIREILEQGY